MVVGLGREDFCFEINDLLDLLRCRWLALSVAGGGIDGLMREVKGDWLKLAGRVFESFAAIPHDRAEEGQIGGGQRTTVFGDGARAGAAIGIVIVEHGEFGGGRNRHFHSDESFGQQQIVRLAAGVFRGNVLHGATGAVIGAEDGIGAMGQVETHLNVRRDHRPGVAGLVAGDAAAAVGAQVLEERVLGRVRGPAKIQIGEAPIGIGELLKSRYELIGIFRDRQKPPGSEDKKGRKNDRKMVASDLVPESSKIRE